MKPKIFAHRGASTQAPENTIPAFEAALDIGVDGVELDVQCTKDGNLAVIHDFVVDTTTSGSGAVSQFSAVELALLDAGSHFSPDFAGVGVPTLNQVLDVFATGDGLAIEVNVEIKSRERNGGDEADMVVQLIRDRNLYDQIIVSSFNPMSLIKCRWLDKDVRIGLLYSELLPPYMADAWLSPIIQPEALHPKAALVDEQHIKWARNLGMAVNTWTVNDVEQAKHLASLGVDVLISDVPDKLKMALL